MSSVEAALRFLHILAATAWLGAALFFVAVLNPAIARSAGDGLATLRLLATRSRIQLYMPLVAGLTVGLGLLLYLATDAHASYADGQLRILNGGATLGVVALLYGALAEGRTTKAIARAAGAPGDGPDAKELPRLVRRLRTQGHVSTVLLVLALGAMATFRAW